MTKSTAPFAAFTLSALMTFGIVAGMNGIATRQYSAAERLAQQAAGATQVAAVQRVVIIGHRAA